MASAAGPAKPTAAEKNNAWVPRDIQYDVGTAVSRAPTADHPLLDRLKATDGPIAFHATAGAGAGDGEGAAAGTDPLTAAPEPAKEEEEELDPLSAMLLAETKASSGAGGGPSAGASAAAAPSFGAGTELHTDEAWAEARHIWNKWTGKKDTILKRFNVAGNVNVTTNFMSDVDAAAAQATPQNRSVALDNSRARLEQLERSHDDTTVEITQQEYLDHIHKLQHDLFGAWMRAERVKSLKITIQCAKLLSHMAVPQFYPTMFCYITGILDTFGQLVFERIRVRAEEVASRLGTTKPLAEDFTCHDIADEAKETCKNWIYKTACIRELVPRLYVEICLLKCYRFITDENDLPSIVERISHMIRGVGDPVLAAYARTYLSLMASQVIHGARNREAVHSGLHDLMFSFKDAVSPAREAWLQGLGLTVPVYLNLMSPAVEWLMTMGGTGASKEDFTGLMAGYKEHCNNSMVLKAILEAYDPEFYAPYTMSLVALCKEAQPSLVSLAELYTALAKGLTKVSPPERMRLPFLNESWKVITKVENPVLYASCAASFTGLLLKAYTDRELLVLLKDLVLHMKRASAAPGAGAGGGGATVSVDGTAAGQLPEATLPHVESVLTQLTGRHGEDIGGIVTSDPFVALLDMFHGQRKVSFCKSLLRTFVENADVTNDPVLIHTLFDVAKTLHDSLDSLSVSDERRQVSDLICRFMNMIDFGRDVEQHLSILVDFRASFSNLDSVKDRLVLEVLKLAMKALKLIRGRHTKKTTAFVKACFAFSHITIPSIDDVFSRLALFKLAGEIALANQCLPQADTFFKAAIQEIPELPEVIDDGPFRGPSEPRLLEFLRSFLSAMIIVPGHPQQGPFYLVKGLQNALQRFSWSPLSPYKTRVFIALLPVLAAYAQTALPYHAAGVESNDVLYAGDPEYTSELVTIVNDVMNDILLQLAAIGKDGSPAALEAQTSLVLELLAQVLSVLRLNAKTTSLTFKLFQLAHKNEPSSPRLAELVQLVHRRAKTWDHLEGLSTMLASL